MFLCFELEQGVRWQAQQVSDAEVELTEERVDPAVFVLGLFCRQAPIQCGGVEAPAGEVRIDGVLLHIAVTRSVQQVLDQFYPLGIFPVFGFGGEDRVLPKAGCFDEAQKA